PDDGGQHYAQPAQATGQDVAVARQPEEERGGGGGGGDEELQVAVKAQRRGVFVRAAPQERGAQAEAADVDGGHASGGEGGAAEDEAQLAQPDGLVDERAGARQEEERRRAPEGNHGRFEHGPAAVRNSAAQPDGWRAARPASSVRVVVPRARQGARARRRSPVLVKPAPCAAGAASSAVYRRVKPVMRAVSRRTVAASTWKRASSGLMPLRVFCATSNRFFAASRSTSASVSAWSARMRTLSLATSTKPPAR